MSFAEVTDRQLAVLITALEQFADNQPERDEWEPEVSEAILALEMLDQAEAERLQRIIGRIAGDASMKAAGRKQWTHDDYIAAAKARDALLPADEWIT